MRIAENLWKFIVKDPLRYCNERLLAKISDNSFLGLFGFERYEPGGSNEVYCERVDSFHFVGKMMIFYLRKHMEGSHKFRRIWQYREDIIRRLVQVCGRGSNGRWNDESRRSFIPLASMLLKMMLLSPEKWQECFDLNSFHIPP